jgi:hypothetical protein
MTLGAALVFWAAFLATVSPRFWGDLLRSIVVVLVGLTMASLLRELFPAPLFAFDQHVGFAVGAAIAIIALVVRSQPLPGFLCASLVLWGALEVLALLYLGRVADPRDYVEQQAVAYFVALMGVMGCCRVGLAWCWCSL